MPWPTSLNGSGGVDLSTGNPQVTHQALRWLLAGQPVRRVIRSMRIHAPAERGVTTHAIALHMAGGAGLQSLSRSAAVLQEPLGLRRVKRDVEAAVRCEARLAMAAAAEKLRIVARSALILTAVRVGRVVLREIGLVEATRNFRRVAIRTELSLVTAGAGQ